MYVILAVIFIFGYVAIAFEHTIKVDKGALAIFTGVLVWSGLILGVQDFFPQMNSEESQHFVTENLMHHLSDIASIIFFLLSAMTIVELIDAHDGFTVIKSMIKTRQKAKLLWILSIVAFFMSATLDNLTTAIVMAALLQKLIKDKNDLWMFAGVIIIAANAGGAWSPIGDVTTIMLWIGGQVSANNIVLRLFLPSLITLLVPLLFISLRMKGNLPALQETPTNQHVSKTERRIVLGLGVSSLLFVPIFKTITHLPPFMGALFGLGILWIVTEILHKQKSNEERKELSVMGVIQRIDTPSMMFFLGILLAVAGLETAGHLADLTTILDKNVGNIYVVNMAIGVLSSIVDNVPLVAGAMKMYSMDVYPQDHVFWEMLALCAGTGGSMLIIGSAAGVAIMGILKINFMWYLRKIAIWAFVGYLAGVGVYILMV